MITNKDDPYNKRMTILILALVIVEGYYNTWKFIQVIRKQNKWYQIIIIYDYEK